MNVNDFAFAAQTTIGIVGVGALAWCSFCFANISFETRELRETVREVLRELKARRLDSAPKETRDRREVVFPYRLDELDSKKG